MNWHHAGVARLGSALLSVVLVGVITLAAYADVVLVGAAVLLVQVLVAAAPGLVAAGGAAISSPRFVPALVAGLVATIVTLEPELLAGATGTSATVVGAGDTGMFGSVLPAVGAAVFVALIGQMLRKDGRTRLVESVSYAVMISVVAALAVGWIGTAQSLGGADVVAVGAAGVAAGLLVWAIPLDRWLCLALAVVAGVGAGAAVAAGVDASMTVLFGVVVGAAAAFFAVIGQVAARSMVHAEAGAAVSWGFPGAAAVAAVAPIIYLGGQLITIPNL